MEKRPIRRKFKDNPYSLEIENELYFIKFKNNDGNHKVLVNKEIYEVFDENERYENSRYYEYSVHIEHFELTEEDIYTKINNYVLEEDMILNKIYFEDILKIINKMSEIQKRRINQYFFCEKTYEQIAQQEQCSKVAVKYSIDLALKKIKQELKNSKR